MAGNELNVITQREQSVADIAEQQGQVAIGMLPSTDGPAKQDIADKGLPQIGAEIGDVAMAMPWAMDHLHLRLPEDHRVALIEPACGLVGARWCFILCSEFRQSGNQVSISPVRPFDPCAAGLGKARCLTCVIKVTVGDQHHFRFDFQKFDHIENRIVIPARIYHRCRAGLFAPDERAVELVAGNLDDFTLHGALLRRE